MLLPKTPVVPINFFLMILLNWKKGVFMFIKGVLTFMNIVMKSSDEKFCCLELKNTRVKSVWK